MSLTEKTPPNQTHTLAFELELRHPPEKVWRALTTPELLAEWLLPVVGLRLTPSAEFTFSAPPQPGWDGQVNCQLLSIDAPRQLSYRWVVGELDTQVTFTLEPTEEGSRLSLTQSGFAPAQKQNFGGARYGWKLMGGKLVALLDRVA